MCHILPVCLFMDARSFQTHICESGTTEQQTAPESEADKPHQYSSYSCHMSVIGSPSCVSSSVCQTHKVRLLGQNKSSWECNLKLSRGYFSTKKFMGWFYASVNKKSQWEFSLRWGYKPHIIKLWLCSPSCFVNLPEQNQIITNSVDLWPCAAPPPFTVNSISVRIICNLDWEFRCFSLSFPLRVDTKGGQLLFDDHSTNSSSNFFFLPFSTDLWIVSSSKATEETLRATVPGLVPFVDFSIAGKIWHSTKSSTKGCVWPDLG